MRETRATAPQLPREVLALLLLAMYSMRNITGATSDVLGHLFFDTFGGEVSEDLENKMTIIPGLKYHAVFWQR